MEALPKKTCSTNGNALRGGVNKRVGLPQFRIKGTSTAALSAWPALEIVEELELGCCTALRTDRVCLTAKEEALKARLETASGEDSGRAEALVITSWSSPEFGRVMGVS